MVELQRLENEGELETIYRICSAKEEIGTWQDVANILNSILGYEYTESKYRKQFQSFVNILDANQNKFVTDSSYLNEIQEQKRELLKVKSQIQTEKTEYNRWLRENARDELILEKIKNCIRSLSPISVPNKLTSVSENEKEYMLIFGDAHYGTEFKLVGFHGETINEYSPEIFESRMWHMYHQTLDIIKKEKISKLTVFEMGDSLDGILRVSQLMKLRYGVVESAIRYANFITEWLNALSEHVYVEYHSTVGNHGQLRHLGQPKGTFEDDNIEKIISEFIHIRLEDNPNFTFVKNPTGYIFSEVAGSHIVGIHGEVKNMEQELKDLSHIYNVHIDYLVAGHLHHSRTEDVGIGAEVINIPSIIGVDSYSLSLRKTSNAAGKLLVFETGKGKVCEYTMKLN